MAYAIRTKGRRHVIRDLADPFNRGHDEPLYEVGPKEWVLFENLPAGVSESGDGDLEVRYVDAVDGAWPSWVTRPESVQAKRARLAAAAAAVAPPPVPIVAESPKARRKAKLSDNARNQREEDDE